MLTAAPFPVKGHSTARACTSLFCTGREERLNTLWLEGPLEQPQHDVMSEFCYRLCVGRVWAERQWRLEESHIYLRVEVIWEITAAGSSARPEVWSTPHPAYSCPLLQHKEFHSSEPVQSTISTGNMSHSVMSGWSWNLTRFALNHILDVAV